MADNDKDDPKSDYAPLFSSYNDEIRPILNKIDKLRHLNLGIQGAIPVVTIVVTGKACSGKSSLIESLVCIRLTSQYYHGTRVPIIICLQNHLKHEPELLLEYNKKTVRIMEENQIIKAIDEATVEIAGKGSRISCMPLTLIVKKKGIPDLTIVDLPGEESLDIAMEYIKPKESIILNVIPESNIPFPCEFISMSQRVDKAGERTLVVVTKCDERLNQHSHTYIAKNLKRFQNHIFVRNRIIKETLNEARIREAMLIESHPLLSKINKSTVGISSLAHRLNKIQLMILSRCLSDILKKITDKLNSSVLELDDLSPNLKSIPDGVIGFLEMAGSFKESLQKILIKGEFDEYTENKKMHGNARLIEMLNKLYDELQTSISFSKKFLVEEIKILEQFDAIRLPYFIPHSAFLCLLKRKVNIISEFPVNFANKVCDYLDTVCVKVLVDHFGNYSGLLPAMRKATRNVVQNIKDRFLERAVELIEMEKITDYTCDPNYIAYLNKLMGNPRDEFLKVMCNHNVNTIDVEGYGRIEVRHLLSVSENMRNQAFDLKMRITAYMNIVMKRIVDSTALQLQFWIQHLVNKEIYAEIMYELIVQYDNIESTPDEPSDMVREKLLGSIGILQISKNVIRKTINGIPVMIN
ncbi:dynamin related protein 4C [Artemisia annua]|uniref:Dynamin related protein 4C n=1 Tax=Artemisia annua TaxID=35608 RepID=A0A2U1KIB3_ARTAN|nr:dynamin related protein 4C [Artemisia annua]